MSAAAPLPDPEIYLRYVDENKAEMQDWAMMVGEPAPEEKPAASAKKGKRGAKVSAATDDIEAGGSL